MLSFALVLLSQIGAPQGVHLLDDTPLLAQVGPPLTPAPASEAQVSAQQLQVDLDALKKQRPGLGAGIALVSSGGTTALLGGLYLGLSSALGSFAGAVNPLMVIGAIGLAIGLPLVIIGVWILYNRLEERQLIDAETKKLREELKRVQPRPPPPQRQYAPPPPSNLPPPQVLGPDARIELAQF